MSEFDFIKRYFAKQSIWRDDVILGSGDDCAVLQPPANQQLVTTIDALVAGVHFPHTTSPQDIGYKSIAVSLSDIAAMGAQPAWVVATLAMPTADETWVSAFADGFFELLNQHGVALVGGDLVQGPLAISTQLTGFVAPNQALLRRGAKPGDLLMVTGTLGDAGLALHQLQQHQPVCETLLHRLNRPTPRLDIGAALVGIASSAIDLSDGLLADCQHLLSTDDLGAEIDCARLPLSEAYRQCVPEELAVSLALSAGDDYELCFTIPPSQLTYCQQLGATQIGEIVRQPGVRCYQGERLFEVKSHGYQHFS